MNAFSKFSFRFTFVASLLFILSFNKKLGGAINTYICAPIRRCIAAITGILKFSVFEFLCIALPLIIFLLVLYTVRGGKIRNIFALFVTVLSLYLLNLGVAYNADTDLTSSESISDSELIETAHTLLSRVNSFSGEIREREAVVHEKISAKEIAASGLLMRFRILGFYSFITSEANVNNILPDYMYYFTAFHEISHVLGYAREGEANLYAYLALKDTGDEYFCFCAELYALEFLLSDVYKISKTEYEKIYASLSEYARAQTSLYGTLLKKYPALSLASRVGDVHLSIWDRTSYSDFTRLLVIANRDGM